MITKEMIDRINALAHKSKTPEGLTPAEKEEQAALRRAYIDAFKANVLRSLENVSIQEEDGSVHPILHQ
jgi:5-formyltetrahydrofolate cyclo-ligase